MERRYHSTSVALDEQSRESLVTAARAADMSVSQYVRHLIARELGTPLTPIYSREVATVAS